MNLPQFPDLVGQKHCEPCKFMDLSPSHRPLVALLVDGENVSKDHARVLIDAGRRAGDLRVRRVYGAANHIAGWEDAGFRLATTRPGKNAADMLLCVEAMILALREGFGTIMVASSDRDFSYLAEQMRELGVQVIGLGESKAPLAFREACSRFEELSLAPPAMNASPSKQIPVASDRRMSLADLAAALLKTEGANGYLSYTRLNTLMWQKHQRRIKVEGFSTWRSFFSDPQRQARFESVNGGSQNAGVRLKPHSAP